MFTLLNINIYYQTRSKLSKLKNLPLPEADRMLLIELVCVRWIYWSLIMYCIILSISPSFSPTYLLFCLWTLATALSLPCFNRKILTVCRHDFLQTSSWSHTGAPCETSVCSRLRCTMKLSNKTRLCCRHEQLRYPAKKRSTFPLADAVDADDFGGTFHLSQMDRKTLPVHRESA